MTVGLDTSIIVRLLTGEPQDLASVALSFLSQRFAAQDRVLVADWVLAETYYALQHHYGASKKEAIGALREFMNEDGIESTGEAVAVLQTPRLESAKPGFIDRVIHAGYLHAGAEEIITFEKASRRLSRVRVLALN